MKEYITESTFIDAFKQSDTRKNQFSYEGLKALFEYLEEYEDSTGEELEFDMIGICCEYTEYDSLKQYNDEYGNECEEIDEIADYTALIKIDDERFIIQQY
jgi:hypothetical protein|tara:strand:- start:51 stop:353 length:303 start_codon:yes stop_codon:yes gene_type:complete